MVTANRLRLARRSVGCYLQQTYPNKELVIVDDGAEDLTPILSDVPAEERVYIRLERNPENVLGHLRNVSLDAASGEFLVQWDDDDWFHPDRIAVQVDVMETGSDACCLHGTLIHIATPSYMYNPYIGFLPDGVPGTIMHRRSDSTRYPTICRGEDTAYLQGWMAHRYHILPAEYVHLFIRCYHGGNTWEQEHFLTRMRNTPADWIAHLWHRYVRRDVFGHSRFRLSPNAEKAFETFLDSSRRLGLLNTFEPEMASV